MVQQFCWVDLSLMLGGKLAGMPQSHVSYGTCVSGCGCCCRALVQVCTSTSNLVNDTAAATAMGQYLADTCFKGQNMDTSICTCVQVGGAQNQRRCCLVAASPTTPFVQCPSCQR